jgi:hypothetical protein
MPRPPTNIVTVLFFIVAVFIILGFGGKALEGYRLRRHNEELSAEVAALEEQREELQARFEYVQTSEYVEEVARGQYRWTKAGETLVIPTYRRSPEEPGNPPATPQPVVSSPIYQPTSYWQDWWALLKGPFD